MTSKTQAWGNQRSRELLPNEILASALLPGVEIPAVQVRPLRPNDATLLHEMHLRLSPMSLIYRYMQYRIPTLQEVAAICNMGRDRGAGLVASTKQADGERIVGVAYYVREAGNTPATAELGILVEDQFQEQGIGRLLWQQLHRHAQADQIVRLRVMFDPGNRRIWHLLKGSGYTYDASYDGSLNDFTVVLDQQPQPTGLSQRLAQFMTPIFQAKSNYQATQYN